MIEPMEIRCPKCERTQTSKAKTLARCKFCKARFRPKPITPRSDKHEELDKRVAQEPEPKKKSIQVEDLVQFPQKPDWSIPKTDPESSDEDADPEKVIPTVADQGMIGRYFRGMGKCLIPVLKGSPTDDEALGEFASATFEMGGMMFAVTQPEKQTEIGADTLLWIGVVVLVICIVLPQVLPDGIGGLLKKLGKKKDNDGEEDG